MKISDKCFFKIPAYELAQQLIGKTLCVNDNGIIKKAIITETECYTQDDSACHAYKGKTKRNSALFNEGGVCYIYLCYGIHQMLNIVAGGKGYAQGCLIRGVKNIKGPGNVTKYFNINSSFYEEDLTTSCRIWLEDENLPLNFIATKRIGINYASQHDIDKLWRFIVKE